MQFQITQKKMEIMRSEVWKAFQQKIEIKILFLHQKKIILFLLGHRKAERKDSWRDSALFLRHY